MCSKKEMFYLTSEFSLNYMKKTQKEKKNRKSRNKGRKEKLRICSHVLLILLL